MGRSTSCQSPLDHIDKVSRDRVAGNLKPCFVTGFRVLLAPIEGRPQADRKSCKLSITSNPGFLVFSNDLKRAQLALLAENYPYQHNSTPV